MPPVLNVPRFHNQLLLAETFIFTTHYWKFQLEVGTEGINFPSGWSGQHSCLIFIFDMGIVNVHVDFFCHLCILQKGPVEWKLVP